jgi:hypothetical protein
LVRFLVFIPKASAISKPSVGDSLSLIIYVLEIMAVMHRAVDFSNLYSSEESYKYSIDKASDIVLTFYMSEFWSKFFYK